MIDPIHFTNYNLSKEQLQEYILFSIAVSGKNATTTAKILDKFLTYIKAETGGRDYFDCLINIKDIPLPSLLKSFGFGCQNMKAKGFIEIAKSGFNLKECSVSDLETITGIGRKTSRFFVMHTRKNANVACLDVHILRWMRKRGFDVPEQTPSSKKRYLEIEKNFLDLCCDLGEDPTTLDLKIWNEERGSFAA